MEKLYYVTSFNKKMFHQTGRFLINSFITSKSEGTLLVAYEDMEQEYIQESIPELIRKFANIEYLSLDNHKYGQWKKSVRSVTPVKHGGTLEEDDSLKVPGKPYYSWNQRATGWASKTFAMKTLVKEELADMIIWVDSDSVFKKKIERKWLEKEIFKIGVDIDPYKGFYHFGPYRKTTMKAAETGLFGFTKPGFHVINKAYTEYMTCEYQLQDRWDDSALYTRLMCEGVDKAFFRDLVTGDNGQSKNHVIVQGPFRKFISHEKGTHNRTILK